MTLPDVAVLGTGMTDMSRRDLAPETCAAALDRYAEAGARHILVMVAGSPAVEHFGQLRAAFVGEHRQALASVSA